MTWAERTLARVLLLLATMLADDPEVRKELHAIATHISVHGRHGDG
jgi:hypothetical protein